MSRLLNPSGWMFEGMAAGQKYQFPPFSIVHIWDEVHAEHIVQRNGKQRGIVTLEPNESERQKYEGRSVEFMKAQALKGLNEILKTLNEALTNEKQAERDVKESKTGGEADKRVINVKKFSTQIEKVESWINEVSSPTWSPKKYLENQIKVNKHEPWDYSSESAPQAG